jgi:hypothetical protein
MREATIDPPRSPRLAAAYLALTDEGSPHPDPRRTSPLLVLALTVVIALAAPLAWMAGPAAGASDLPKATPAAKATVPAPGDDGADG